VKTKHVVSVLLFLCLLITSCSPANPNEELFYKSVKDLNKLISLFSKIKEEQTTTYEGHPAIIMSTEKRQQFVESTKKKWLDVINNLEAVKNKEYDKWSDDALFCIVMSYLYVTPSNQLAETYSDGLLQAYTDLMNKGDFIIEPLTKRKLSSMFESLLNTFENEFPDSTPENDILKARLTEFTAERLMMSKKYKSSIALFTKLASQYSGSAIGNYASGMIEELNKAIQKQ